MRPRQQTLTAVAPLILALSIAACSKREKEDAVGVTKPNVTTAGVKRSEVTASDLSFYQVGLACKAAPKIGCGSRAKPLLLSLTANSRVAGAWLNGTGTRLAIAWKHGSTPMTIEELGAVLAPHGLAAEPADDAPELLAAFKSNGGWFDAATVDRLSEQEAGVIAARLVARLAAKTSLTSDQQARLRTDVENVVRSYITSGRALAARDEETRIRELRDAIVAAEKPSVNATVLSALEDVVALGYRPLPGEE